MEKENKKKKKKKADEVTNEPVMEETFGSDDFYLSAYLVVKGVKLVNFDPTNPLRVVFIFENGKKRIEATEDFLLGRGLVEPKHYAATMKDLKRLINEGQSLQRYR